jgi:hypothetical protein
MEAISVARASFMALERVANTRARSRSGAPNRTRAKVHPHSRVAGTFEQDFFFSYAKGETDRLYKYLKNLFHQKNAIRRLARAEGRDFTADEAKIVSITDAALRVFEVLKDLARTCAGKVFPTWDYIEEKSGLSHASVGRGLDILCRIGLLEKQRRCTPIEPTAERPKARYEQTSNAYRLRFPNCLVRFLPRRFRPVPLPDDITQGEADRIEDIEAMRLWRSPRQVIAEDIEDAEMRKLLLRMNDTFERRESQKNTQPLLDSYSLFADGVGLVGQRFDA